MKRRSITFEIACRSFTFPVNSGREVFMARYQSTVCDLTKSRPLLMPYFSASWRQLAGGAPQRSASPFSHCSCCVAGSAPTIHRISFR